MPPRKFRDIEECRPEIVRYANHLERGTDDDDPDKRGSGSLERYYQDLRWYDHWLDEQGIDDVLAVEVADTELLGHELDDTYNGSTGRYRWDRIYSMYDYFLRLEKIQSNPLERWDGQKTDNWGLTKTSEQSKQLEEGEDYAVSRDELRLMEEHVERHKIRDRLLLRLLWYTALRRQEAASIELKHIDEDAREIHIPASVAKNDKPRVVAWKSPLDGLLRKYLHRGYRDDLLAGNDHEELFIGERGAPLRPEAINEIVIRAADNAGINRKVYADANAPENDDGETEPNRWLISAHSIRRGIGTHLVNNSDMTIYEASKYLGHSSVSVTENSYVSHDPYAGTESAHEHLPE